MCKGLQRQTAAAIPVRESDEIGAQTRQKTRAPGAVFWPSPAGKCDNPACFRAIGLQKGEAHGGRSRRTTQDSGPI
jgi:hypothetical protein